MVCDAGAAKQSGVKGFREIAGECCDLCPVTRDHLITLSARVSTWLKIIVIEC